MTRPFRPVTPAEGPGWLVRFADSIAGLFRQIMPVPFRLREYASGELPSAAEWTQGLVFDTDRAAPLYSDGTNWVRLSAYDGDVAAIGTLSATGMLCRTGADSWILRSVAGTANQVSVTNGGGVLGAPTISLPDAITAPGSLTVTSTTIGMGAGTFGGTVATSTPGTGFVTASLSAAANNSTTGHVATLEISHASSGGNVYLQSELLASGVSRFYLRIRRAGGMHEALRIDSDGTLTVSVGTETNILDSSGWNLAGGNAYRINGVQLVGARKTGWATATGTATRTTFDTATVTTAQLAERVKALIDDLHGAAGHGLIGT